MRLCLHYHHHSTNYYYYYNYHTMESESIDGAESPYRSVAENQESRSWKQAVGLASCKW